MKQRIKIDGALLGVIVIFTVILYLSKDFYIANKVGNIIFDCLGYAAIIKGSLLRMAARGHKKSNSREGGALVTTGPYSISRNPMYLGSFMIGSGFILLMWPWWMFPFFAVLFYARFNHQIKIEETLLTNAFREEFAQYCYKVPRIFPSISTAMRIKTKEVFNIKEAFSTKEKRDLYFLPPLALLLALLREAFVFGRADVVKTVEIFIGTCIVFAILFGMFYKFK